MTASPDFSSSTLTDLQKLTDERNQARDIAVRLEQENARMTEALRGIADLSHSPHRSNWAAWCPNCIASKALAAAPVDGAE